MSNAEATRKGLIGRLLKGSAGSSGIDKGDAPSLAEEKTTGWFERLKAGLDDDQLRELHIRSTTR